MILYVFVLWQIGAFGLYQDFGI